MMSLLTKVFRKKQLTSDISHSKFNRCLSTFDLIMIGIASIFGSGMYVLTGEIAHSVSGPAVTVSFLLAGITQLLSVMCIAELGSRVPTTGSVYLYTYLAIGEIVAFMVAWNVILDNLITAAVIARTLLAYLNDILNDSLGESLPAMIEKTSFNPYTLFFVVPFSLIVLTGIKPSAIANNFLAIVNLSVTLLVIIGGFYVGSWSNWVEPDGYFPFGIPAIFDGAAQAFFGFLGYESIVIVSEEAKNPEFSVPFALYFSMGFVILLYCAVCSALTFMSPYTEIVTGAVFSTAFRLNGWKWAEVVVVCGAMLALSGNLLIRLMVLPRLMYAVAKDGLLFEFLSWIHPITQIPVSGGVVTGVAVALLSCSISLPHLVELLAMGQLQAHLFVALSLIVVRYSPQDLLKLPDGSESILAPCPETEPLEKSNSVLGSKPFRSLCILLGLLVITTIAIRLAEYIPHRFILFHLLLIGILTVCIISSLIFLYVTSEQNSFTKVNRVPFVPFLPAFSMFINLQLMTRLSWMTWVRLFVWYCIGLPIYFLYGLKNSAENAEKKNDAKRYGAIP